MNTFDISAFDNKNVEITSVYFRNKQGGRRFETWPRRMVYDGREYNFSDSGMRYLVRKGQELIRLFDMSDGQNQYRLRLDGANHWSLINMKVLA